MSKEKLIKFLPTYVGSKSWWVKHLQKFKGERIVESFCGSAVLSSNLASECVLNDLDPYIYKILSRFDKQVIKDVFTPEDYFYHRGQPDWWKYCYSLMKLSFSGVFRYSKNGFNVPIKHRKNISVGDDYNKALNRWRELSPMILNKNYWEINEHVTHNSILILDPPYEKAQASYNLGFNYEDYWLYVYYNEHICKTVVLFDFLDNMLTSNCETRNTRVNGARTANKEAIFEFNNSLKEGQYGEELFAKKYEEKLERLDGLKNDFRVIKSGKTIELKGDYYDMNRTPNFFIERFSYRNEIGGPWQALANNNDFFVYWFIKNKVEYIFKTKELVERLDKIVDNYELTSIQNIHHVTRGYKIPRTELEDIATKRE